MKPLISVLIPTCNYGAFIGEAIESVHAQTVKEPYEIIVLDDGSTDDTREVVARYPDVRYFYQDNAGVAAARNKLIELARGEYVAFLDADDCYEPFALEKLSAFFRKNSDYKIVFGKCKNFVEDNTELRIPEAANEEIFPLLSASLVWRGLFNKYDTFDETLRFGEDMLWFMKLKVAKEPIGSIDEIIAGRRLHGENITQTLIPSQGNVSGNIMRLIRRAKKEAHPHD